MVLGPEYEPTNGHEALTERRHALYVASLVGGLLGEAEETLGVVLHALKNCDDEPLDEVIEGAPPTMVHYVPNYGGDEVRNTHIGGSRRMEITFPDKEQLVISLGSRHAKSGILVSYVHVTRPAVMVPTDRFGEQTGYRTVTALQRGSGSSLRAATEDYFRWAMPKERGPMMRNATQPTSPDERKERLSAALGRARDADYRRVLPRAA
jgi:hypothetical protein